MGRMQIAQPVARRTRGARLFSALRWPLLMLVICAGFFWKLTLSHEYSWLDGSDFAYQVLPWYQFQASEWHHGRFPLWDPYLWGGQPLLAQMQPGAAYPPNWLLFLLPFNKGGFIRLSHLHWYFVLIHFQAALFSYWLCRDLKRSHAASMLAGLAFGLGGFMGTTDWPQMLNGAVWAPLVLMFFLRAMRGERPAASAAWSGGFLGIAFLSGHHQVPVFICLMMAGLWIYHLARDVQNVKYLLIFGAFCALLAAFQVLPGYEYGKLSLRWVGMPNPVTWKDKIAYFVHQKYSLTPASILGIVIPGMSRNADPFIGLAGFTLALLGLAASWRDRTVRLLGAIALGGLLFSLGTNSVFHGVLYALVPLVEKARNASMAIFIFHFGISTLIAYGIDGYTSASSEISKRAIWVLIGFATLLGVMMVALMTAKMAFEERIGITALAGFLLAAVLGAWRAERISSRAATTSLLLLILLELGNVTTYGMRSQGEVKLLVTKLSDHADIAEFLRSRKEPVRADIEAETVPYNFGDWYAIDHFGGYLASLTENLMRIQGSPQARQMYGVNFRVDSKSTGADQAEVFSGSSGVKVFSKSGAFPRAWIVHDVFRIERDDQIEPQIRAPGFDAARQVFVKGASPSLEQCRQPETVTLLSREGGHVALNATLHCRGMVIDADTYYPGWVAEVDGKAAQVYEAYGFLRGVVVDAGTHRIEMRFRPKSVYLGAALSALGLLGAILIRWRS